MREYPLGETEVMLFAESRQVVHALNTSAWAIWEMCDGTRTVEGIAQDLGREVERSPGALLPDVIAAVTELGALGLLDAV